ncbi:VOC family protein [Frankia sp. AgB32]|uniref:VOC family protein n=1 Tax=Frankia sp. AgB32 TaxID=631119 RepID=UPI00200F426F|nr:VOC family protein [Frankia sp. AgB32]MCK9895946.1 VOC family protein [Frankia sp. AgB32]
MAVITAYEPGTPCWVDLASPDVEASRAFYGALFGWEAQVFPDPAAGGYTIFTLGGLPVAGLGPRLDPAWPAAWATYLRVEDADEVARSVRAAGGAVLAAPRDVSDLGRMAVFADPAGAAISVWQPGAFPGAGVRGEPGSFCWNELDSRDLRAARAFYPAVFGWTIADPGPGDGPMEYYEWKLAGAPVAGLLAMPPVVAAQVPSRWLTYFAVADTDAALTRVGELGGTVLVTASDLPTGRFALAAGPHGDAFAIIARAGATGTAPAR